MSSLFSLKSSTNKEGCVICWISLLRFNHTPWRDAACCVLTCLSCGPRRNKILHSIQDLFSGDVQLRRISQKSSMDNKPMEWNNSTELKTACHKSNEASFKFLKFLTISNFMQLTSRSRLLLIKRMST